MLFDDKSILHETGLLRDIFMEIIKCVVKPLDLAMGIQDAIVISCRKNACLV